MPWSPAHSQCHDKHPFPAQQRRLYVLFGCVRARAGVQLVMCSSAQHNSTAAQYSSSHHNPLNISTLFAVAGCIRARAGVQLAMCSSAQHNSTAAQYSSSHHTPLNISTLFAVVGCFCTRAGVQLPQLQLVSWHHTTANAYWGLPLPTLGSLQCSLRATGRPGMLHIGNRQARDA